MAHLTNYSESRFQAAISHSYPMLDFFKLNVAPCKGSRLEKAVTFAPRPSALAVQKPQKYHIQVLSLT